MHPNLVPFYEQVWTATLKDVPYPGLDLPHLRDRMRADLSQDLDHPITWDEVFCICADELGIPAGFLEAPIPEYTYAMMQLANAWLVRRFPRAGQNRILAVAQVIAQAACEEAAYGPPEDRATYRRAIEIRKTFQGNLKTPEMTDQVIDQIIQESLANRA